MSQPLDRGSTLPELGKVDREAGEFWVANPFLMLANHQNLSAYERNKVYLNMKGQSFLDISYASLADIDSDSRSAIAADFDRDGAPDMLVGSVGGGPLRLFLNRYPQKNRVQIKLIGVQSNRDAIGTRVVADCGNRKVVRDVFAANGFQGQGPPELSLGIGDAAQIDHLNVRWPTGRIQVFENIEAGSRITIHEGKNQLQIDD